MATDQGFADQTSGLFEISSVVFEQKGDAALRNKHFILKRAIDIALSLVALIVLSPLLLAVMLILRVTGEHEVFYLQDRVGYKNRVFKIWKFATMAKGSADRGTGGVTLRNDSRVTPVGRILRISKINELPQLVNVLRGEMSVVGPRPLMLAGFDLYSDEYKELVYRVKPGLTGIGSIIFRDEERILSESGLAPYECYEKVILPYKGELEVWYQKNQSFGTDFKLVFLTAWVIVFPHSRLVQRFFPDLPRRPFRENQI